jgi:hypothetical protein
MILVSYHLILLMNIPIAIVANKNLNGQEYRDLVICNDCFWSASLLKGSNGFDICPIYGKTNLEITPVDDYEDYLLHIDQRRGIDIEFSDNRRKS